MAILSKIRQLPIILIILIIGLPLLTFVMDPSALTDFFNAKKVNSVGEVAGEPITRQEFAEALDTYRTQTKGRVSEMQAAKSVWNNLLSDRIYKQQLEQSGITINETDILNKLYEIQFIQNDPRFQVSGIFNKDQFKSFLAKIKAENSTDWKNWENYIKSVKSSLEKTTYDNLVSAGLGASLKEGETKYMNDNTKVSGELVYVPFETISDSLINISNEDVQAYVTAHEKEFQVEASRDLEFVRFLIQPTQADEELLNKEVATLINDHEEYSEAAKSKVMVKGFKNATNYKYFLEDNQSDLPLNEGVQFKSQVPQVIADKLFSGVVGDVFGPYKDNGYLKISKITDIVKIPDSVKARHILIPFIGANSEGATKTEEAAKKTADSILNVVKTTPSKFVDLAKQFSSDKSNADKGGDLKWFTYETMVPEFRDYAFENKKGDIGVVKTIFGYHIIRIDDQAATQNGLRLATFARKLDPSEATEGIVFQNAESFVQELVSGKNINEVAKSSSLKVIPAIGVKALDDNIPSLGKERQVITWAFGKDVKVGDYKRFDVDGGYVVVKVTGVQQKGLISPEQAMLEVRPLLIKKKKAEMIKTKMTGKTLKEISDATKESVKEAKSVSLVSPTISGVGFEPNVIAVMINAKENTVYKDIVGNKGVFAVKVTGKELPTALPNYNTERNRIAKQRQGKTYRMFEAIKKASGIEDNLSSFYGIQ